MGLAKLRDREEDTHLTITGARGTPGYAAPELRMPLPVTHKCDVYSYGMDAAVRDAGEAAEPRAGAARPP